MPRIARKKLVGKYFHIMVQGLNKEYIFCKENYKEKYISILKENINKYNIDIIAYCIMDNHVHLLIHTDDIENMSNWMQKVNTKYAIYYNHSNKRVGYVYRNRFNNQEIQDENHLKNCIVYIHNNPVKAKMVNNLEEYRYSSYKEYLGIQEVISKDILQKLFDMKDRKKYYNTITLLHKKNIEEQFIEIKENIDYNSAIKEYKINNLSNEQIIIKLKEEYHLSQRKIASLLNTDRYYIRKCLKSKN